MCRRDHTAPCLSDKAPTRHVGGLGSIPGSGHAKDLKKMGLAAPHLALDERGIAQPGWPTFSVLCPVGGVMSFVWDMMIFQ